MDEMIKNRCLPDGSGIIYGQQIFQSMGTKRS